MLSVVLLASAVHYLERSLLLLIIAVSDLYSVFFGITLRFLVINTSSSVSRHQQTTPLIDIHLPNLW